MGYGRKGNASTSKLTRELVIFMRKSPLPHSAFCRMYGLSYNTVARARRGETWSWVEEGIPTVGTPEDMAAREDLEGLPRLEEKEETVEERIERQRQCNHPTWVDMPSFGVRFCRRCGKTEGELKEGGEEARPELSEKAKGYLGRG